MPDLISTVAHPYQDQGLVTWLINAGQSQAEVQDFVLQAGADMPVLLDERQEVYDQFEQDEAFAPFPLHVVVGRDGVIRYIARQVDHGALTEAIEAALAE